MNADQRFAENVNHRMKQARAAGAEFPPVPWGDKGGYETVAPHGSAQSADDNVETPLDHSPIDFDQ